MALLLQDSRVRAIVNVRSKHGYTALRHASFRQRQRHVLSLVLLFLRAGANPALADGKGGAPFAWLRREVPSLHTAVSLLEESIAGGAEKISLLIKARCLITFATSTRAMPSYLQGRVARGQDLPHVALLPVVGGHDDEAEESRKL